MLVADLVWDLGAGIALGDPRWAALVWLWMRRVRRRALERLGPVVLSLLERLPAPRQRQEPDWLTRRRASTGVWVERYHAASRGLVAAQKGERR